MSNKVFPFQFASVVFKLKVVLSFVVDNYKYAHVYSEVLFGYVRYND